MPPKRSTKSRTKDNDEAGDEMIVDQAQEQPGGQMDMSHIMQEAQKRQVIKRRQAEKIQVEIFTQAEEELAALDAEHAKQLRKLYRQQLTNLRELRQDKANIECELLASMQMLQKAYNSTHLSIKRAMEGRISDLG